MRYCVECPGRGRVYELVEVAFALDGVECSLRVGGMVFLWVYTLVPAIFYPSLFLLPLVA